jgi:hypothetical protein
LKFDYTSPFTGETEALKVPIGVDFFYPTEWLRSLPTQENI